MGEEAMTGGASFPPLNFTDSLNNLGASTSSASSTSSVSSTFGDTNIASGKSTAGSFGVVKGLAFAIVALAAFAIYEYAATKRG